MRYFLYGVIMIIAFLWTVNLVYAHDWYDRECCSGQDCRKANPGEVTTNSTGYQTHGEHIPFNDPRVKASKDSATHICKPAFSSKIRCLYVSMGV